MQHQKKNQSGTIMVEVIAVLGLIGVMGTAIYRQVQRRNEELDNINIASEARTIKEATLAYIQANRSKLEDLCTIDSSNGYGEYKFTTGKGGDLDKIEAFLPDNWTDGIMNEYDVYGTCYYLGAGAGDRKGYYATIIPKATSLPANFNLRRAGRVAMFIGADAGIHEARSNKLVGTMGSWETNCPPDADCPSRTDDFFVVTTGLDTYIPEVEDIPDNAVSAPGSMAFNRLHSTHYFSVGSGSENCVTNYDKDAGKFAHQTLSGSEVPNDEITYVGTNDCDPLFWVGIAAGGNDKSESGHAYVKKNLYIGRDNGHMDGSTSAPIHAVAIETDKDVNANRQITVHDINGRNRLTLNANGEVIGRTNGTTGSGYKLDAATGEIILFKEANVTIGTGTSAKTGLVQAATTRIKDGMLETNKDYTYSEGGAGKTKTEKYRVDPAYTSLMNDIRLSSRGGAKLSDLLPNYIAKEIQSIKNSGTVSKPNCPDGYAKALVVTPISWSQYVKSINLTINQDTDSKLGTTTHAHNVNLTLSDDSVSNGKLEARSDGSSLTLTQHKPVQIAIDNNWNVTLKYGDTAPTVGTDDITALAQTYCVFDKDKFSAGGADYAMTGYDKRKGTAPDSSATVETDATRPCTNDYDCANTEHCTTVDSKKVCTKYGSCSETNGKSLGNSLYCIGGQQTYVACLDDTGCGGKTCTNNRCK